jgi:hypothetical protein
MLLQSLKESVETGAKDSSAHLKTSTRTAPELGRVNGIPAARATWEGTFVDEDANLRNKHRGFVYELDDRTTDINITCSDEIPRNERLLRLSETAVLTLQKFP